MAYQGESGKVPRRAWKAVYEACQNGQDPKARVTSRRDLFQRGLLSAGMLLTPRPATQVTPSDSAVEPTTT